MRMTIAAVTALAGSLLLAPTMLGPAKAAGAPDLKNALSATHDGAVKLVRDGGGGGPMGGFAMGGGHMGGGWGGGWGVHHGGGFGPRFAAHEFHHGFNHDNFHTSITVASSSAVPSSLAATRTMATATVIG